MRLLALLFLLLALPSSLATTYHERSPEEMVLAADMIFVGTVETLRDSGTAALPWTEVSFRVEEWLASEGSPVDRADPADDLPDTVSLRFLGGAVGGGARLTVSGLPQFRQGQRVLLLAYEDEGLASPIVGVRQGLFTLDVRGARDEAGSYLAVPSEGRLQRSPTGAGLEEVLTAISDLLEDGNLPPALEPASGEDEGPASPEEPADNQSGETDDAETDTQPEPPAEPETEPEPPAEPEPEPETETEPDPDPTTDGDVPAEDHGQPDPEDEPEEPPTADSEPSDSEPSTDEAQTPGTASDTLITVRYQVDESGGPLLLSTAVERAADAWENAAPEAVQFLGPGDVAETEPEADSSTAPHQIGFGDPSLFGRDALSFTLVRSGSAATEVLVSPTAGSLLDAVLLHDLGVLIGLPEGGQGVMASTVMPGATAPAPADVEALRALQVFRPEDINRDGVIDFYDLAALAEAFGTRGVNLAADLNGDGVVDQADLETLRRAYQFLPPAEGPPD